MTVRTLIIFFLNVGGEQEESGRRAGGDLEESSRRAGGDLEESRSNRERRLFLF